MKRLFLSTAIAITLSGVARADTAASPTNTTQALMRQKLEAAHGLLEGMVRGDDTQIERHLSMLANISKATTWHKLDSPDFLAHARSFSSAIDDMKQQLKKKDSEGLAVAYGRVTSACIQCHATLRGRK